MKRRDLITATASLAAPALAPRRATAQDRSRTLLSVSENGPNALDFHSVGANRSVYAVVWNCYDRLISFAVKRDANGQGVYDYTRPVPELAEDVDFRPDSALIRLRRNAVFHDGAPVTAADVKYSFDRAVSVGGYPASTMQSANLTDPAQFVVIDDHTIRIDYREANKYAPLYLGAPVVGIYNSRLVKSHATEADPWAQDYTRNAVAGSGAFKVERNTPGQEMVLTRNDAWVCGPRPALDRVIWRVVPSPGTRRALLERGDADLITDLAPKDAAELATNPALRVWGTPMENTITYLGLNTKMRPFDDIRVRQAIAWALPYEKIMSVALYGRGRALFGGPDTVSGQDWPQPTRYTTNIAKAKALLAEAGLPNGFETTLSFDLGQAATHEPMAVLIAESLGAIGIRATIDKIPGSRWRAAFSAKTLPMQINLFGGWFNFSDFYFYFVYDSRNTIFNTMDYANPALDRLVHEARLSTDPAVLARDAPAYIQIAYDEVPNIPLFQPNLEVAMARGVSGFTYWFHREVDYRAIRKVT